MRAVFVMILTIVPWQHALAASRVTVKELRQTVESRIAARAKDEDLARQLGSLSLSERLTAHSMDAMLSSAAVGAKTKEALQLLADSSAFLEPPASEIVRQPDPDTALQQKMMNAAVNFVAVTLHHLPDFLATRETRSFDNSPLVVTHSGWSPAASEVHLAGSFLQEITYRNGREIAIHSVVNSGADTKHGPSPPGLTSTGEFGPVLATVLRDVSKGTVSWSHWEQMEQGVGAVFNYKVPKSASHYEVSFCCVRGSEDSENYSGSSDEASNSYRGTPAYHGSLFIDPSTGSILRITVDPELSSDGPIMRSAISVSYGPVEIGGNRYVCPVRSIAISDARTRLGGDMGERTILRINEVKFTNYHRFGSTSRIVMTDAEPK